MVGRVATAGDIVFTGGVAKNLCMRALLAQLLGRRILLPAEPQLAGALGAALLALESEKYQ
jgi:activator of 2-hydroxyglutaryl-CoA dehydratase